MDGTGFDTLTRTLSNLRSRRGLAQVLLGVALGGTPALRDLDPADAKRGTGRKRRKQREQHRERTRDSRDAANLHADKKKGKKKPCPPCKKRKQGKCKGTLPDGSACPSGSCQAGSCVPTTPACTPSCTGKVCGDNGCGTSCGSCSGGQTCQGGRCVLTCDSGLTACTGACVDLQTDAANCGTCGEACGFPHASATCQGGVCTLGACDAGWDTCDSDPDTGCEQDVRDDPANCGACGHACEAPPHGSATCANSSCGFACDPDFHDCAGSCVRDDDPAHCGSSCTPCPGSVCSPATCDGAACGRAPIAGCCEQDSDCGDGAPCTADTCGADHTCQHAGVCPPSEVCIAEGTQAHCCPASQPLWNGTQCAECTPGDVTRCATLPHATATCDEQGACGFTCDAGWGDCGSGAGCETNLRTDDTNCGACGHVCLGDEQCSAGSCCRDLQPTDDLQAAVDAAPPGATLRLCAGTWELPSRLLPTRDLTLIGAGAGQTILTGGDGCVVQTLNGTVVTLRDLTITGGNELGLSEGGGIMNYTGPFLAPPQLTLIGVHVTNNVGAGILNYHDALLVLKAGTVISGNGPLGGIANYEGDVTLEGSRVEGNTAATFGGGISSAFGTVRLKAGSSVSGNSAVTFHGGGISTREDTLVLENGSSVTGNSANAGGGIASFRSAVTLAVGSKVTGNTAWASGGGGGFFCSSGEDLVTLEASDIVVDNHEEIAGETTVSNCQPVDTIPNCIG